MLPIALYKALGVGGGGGGGALWVRRLSGSDIMVVWGNVAMGVAKQTRCWLHEWADGLGGESGTLGFYMIGMAW